MSRQYIRVETGPISVSPTTSVWHGTNGCPPPAHPIPRVLMSLRIFVETCPLCDCPAQVEQAVVGSCCRSYDVVAAACQDCDTRLFEMEWDEIVAEEARAQSP